jgi:hypothetical protein
MRPHTPSVTSLPPSPDAERHSRMLRYAIAMGIRMVCIALCLVVQGWWLLLPAAGAIFLPFFAVVIANAVAPKPGAAVERPGSIERVREP